jgi:diacylglycerol kinase
MFSIKRLLLSFKTAFDGLIFIFKSEPNFRLQIIFAIIALFFACFFHLRTYEWIVVILLIVMVLVMEIFNTALEQFTDLLKPRLHHYVKAIKDIMAASVLLTAIGALIVGLIIFWPYFSNFINDLL